MHRIFRIVSSHTELFRDRRFFTETFTQRGFYTQKLLHTEAFTHRRLYTDAFTHRSFYTYKLLHTEAVTHRRFYTQTLLHTESEAFTHRRLYTQMLLHTDAFTHSCFTCFYTLRRTTWKSQFYLSFWRSKLISCERVARDNLQSQFYPSFWRPILISCERVAPDTLKSQFYFSFWRSNSVGRKLQNLYNLSSTRGAGGNWLLWTPDPEFVFHSVEHLELQGVTRATKFLLIDWHQVFNRSRTGDAHYFGRAPRKCADAVVRTVQLGEALNKSLFVAILAYVDTDRRVKEVIDFLNASDCSFSFVLITRRDRGNEGKASVLRDFIRQLNGSQAGSFYR